MGRRKGRCEGKCGGLIGGPRTTPEDRRGRRRAFPFGREAPLLRPCEGCRARFGRPPRGWDRIGRAFARFGTEVRDLQRTAAGTRARDVAPTWFAARACGAVGAARDVRGRDPDRPRTRSERHLAGRHAPAYRAWPRAYGQSAISLRTSVSGELGPMRRTSVSSDRTPRSRSFSTSNVFTVRSEYRTFVMPSWFEPLALSHATRA